jgi:hypothetical protein
LLNVLSFLLKDSRRNRYAKYFDIEKALMDRESQLKVHEMLYDDGKAGPFPVAAFQYGDDGMDTGSSIQGVSCRPCSPMRDFGIFLCSRLLVITVWSRGVKMVTGVKP